MRIKTMPQELSDEAYLLYQIASQNHGQTIQGEDWSKSVYFHGKRVVPNLDAVPELVDAGLARYSSSTWGGETRHYLWLHTAHEQYSHLDGEYKPGSQNLYAEVYAVDETRFTESLLASLVGATYIREEGRGRYNIPTWKLALRHATATDVEHDAAHLADFTIENPVLESVSAQGTTMIGRLTHAQFYPRGTVLVNEDTEMCVYSNCQDDPHPVVEYLPPVTKEQVDLAGTMVKIVLRDARLMDEDTLSE